MPRRSSSSSPASSDSSSATITFPQRSNGIAVLLAELVQLARALDAQPRLERARRVVDARVDDSAVVAGLVEADVVLLLEDDDRAARVAAVQLARDREPEDAGADDGDVYVARANRPFSRVSSRPKRTRTCLRGPGTVGWRATKASHILSSDTSVVRVSQLIPRSGWGQR